MPNNSEYTIIKTIKHLTINKNSIEEQIYDDSVKVFNRELMSL